MRKLLVGLMALGVLAAVSSSAFAFTSSVSISTLTATAQFTSTGSVSMSLAYSSLSGGTASQQAIWWNTASYVLGQTAWKSADTCLVLTTTMTASGGAVRIYTNNCLANNPGVSPYSGYAVQTSTNSPSMAGLIASSTNTAILPVCWRVSVSTLTPAINQGGPLGVGELWDTAGGNTFPCYLWMMDKGSYAFNPLHTAAYAGDYSIIRDANRGMQYAEANWGAPGTNSVYVYIGANFQAATGPNTYMTSALCVEAFYE